MSFLIKRIEENNRRNSRRYLNELLQMTCNKQLFESFIDDIDVETEVKSQSEIKLKGNYRFALQFCIGANVEVDENDDVETSVNKIVDKIKLEQILKKLNWLTDNTLFINSNPSVSLKILDLLTLLDEVEVNKDNFNFEDFGNINPLTEYNIRNALADCIRIYIMNPESKNKVRNILFFYINIKYNPKRVTFKTLKREILNFAALLDELVIRFNEGCAVASSSIYYKDMKDASQSQMTNLFLSSASVNSKNIAQAVHTLDEKAIWKFGCYMYSNGHDSMWNSVENSNKYSNSLKSIYNGYQTINQWMENLMRNMADSDIFTWNINGYWYEELSEPKMTVLVQNVSQRNKNTVNVLMKEFEKCVNELTWKNRMLLKQKYHVLNVYFIYEGSGETPDRLPNGKFSGFVELDWGFMIYYHILDDSPNFREYGSKKQADDPYTKPHYQRREIVYQIQKFNPTLMKEKEDQSRQNTN